eukprot:gb/GFBE01058572.1/.p1 GENE.gb/GFBE01058572.1/~~gb/GFBE01058572.1/.p1  ORF type:complete len:231 (+),score=51.18 gb/GFBE01058572.1/:1-693(+)
MAPLARAAYQCEETTTFPTTSALAGSVPRSVKDIPLPFKLMKIASKEDETSSTTASEDYGAPSSSSGQEPLVSLEDLPVQRRRCCSEDLEGKTTLMVRNLPQRANLERLMEVWPLSWGYDFIYLPYRLKQRCPSCYCFLNFKTPQQAKEFHNRCDGLYFPGTDVQVTVLVAHTQGLEENLKQYRAKMSKSRRAIVINNGVPVFVDAMDDTPSEAYDLDSDDLYHGQVWRL